jgi:pyruvate dehydrogenase E2 component (dihydrolipoamide acetyltransferase)
MAKIIGLPKLSPTMEEGTLVRWVKQEGDSIEVDDLIAEVETDKATMEFRSFDKGVLLKQLAPEGTTLAPEQPVAIFGNAGEDISALLDKAGGKAATPPAPAAPKKEAEAKKPTGTAEASEADVDEGEAPAEPARQGDNARTEEAEPQPPSSRGRSEEGRERVEGRVLASPLVRKLARENDIDLASVRGSGPGGRVIKRDVEGDGRVGLPGNAVRGPSAPPPPRRPKEAEAPAARAPEPPAMPSGGRSEKLSQMRKTIARRLTESKRDVPHFYLTIDVDAEPLVGMRAMYNEQLAKSGEKVSLNDLIIKACASALRKMPRVNASFAGDSIVYHDGVHISVAVAVPDGLLTPVVRDADRLGVLAISQAVRDLAERAKGKKLKPEEMQGGTFSISNLGMFGIDAFSAVINPPEGAILAVGQVREEPVVKAGAVVPGKRLALTMSCDHRVIDGAVGAEWLKLLRGMIESPMTMLL